MKRTCLRRGETVIQLNIFDVNERKVHLLRTLEKYIDQEEKQTDKNHISTYILN